MVREPSLPHYDPASPYAPLYGGVQVAAPTQRLSRALEQEFVLHRIDHWPMPVLGVHCFVEEVVGDVPVDEMVLRLAADSRVESVQPMHRFHVLSGLGAPRRNISAMASGSVPVPGGHALQFDHTDLDRIHQVSTGRGVVVAEIDTGVDPFHPALHGQLLPMINVVDSKPAQSEVHGTAVAGVMVAHPQGQKQGVGVAPAAAVLPLRACWQEAPGSMAGVCDSFTLAKALEVALREHVKVINMSLSGPNDLLLSRLIDKAVASGTIVVAAVDPRDPSGGFPARLADVVSVGGEEGSGVAGGKAIGRSTAVLAPARDVLTTIPPADWALVSGNSFAAAQVSGLAALTLEIRPSLSPGGFSKLLRESAFPSPSGRVVDACALLSAVGVPAPCALRAGGSDSRRVTPSAS